MVYKIDYSKVSPASYIQYSGAATYIMVSYINGQYILSCSNGNGAQFNNSTIVIGASSMLVTWYVKTTGNSVVVETNVAVANGGRIEFFY